MYYDGCSCGWEQLYNKLGLVLIKIVFHWGKPVGIYEILLGLLQSFWFDINCKKQWGEPFWDNTVIGTGKTGLGILTLYDSITFRPRRNFSSAAAVRLEVRRCWC